jgi:hypothetical protein
LNVLAGPAATNAPQTNTTEKDVHIHIQLDILALSRRPPQQVSPFFLENAVQLK